MWISIRTLVSTIFTRRKNAESWARLQGMPVIPGLGRLGQKDHGLDVDSGYTVSLPWEVKEVTYELHNQDTRFGFRFLGLCFVLAFLLFGGILAP